MVGNTAGARGEVALQWGVMQVLAAVVGSSDGAGREGGADMHYMLIANGMRSILFDVDVKRAGGGMSIQFLVKSIWKVVCEWRNTFTGVECTPPDTLHVYTAQKYV